MLSAIADGFFVLELQFNDDGTVSDAVRQPYPSTDPLASLRVADTERARVVLPSLETKWLQRFGAVARTGEAEHFEGWSETARRWYDVMASPLGAAGTARVAVLLTDITERKRREREQFLLADIAQDIAKVAESPAAQGSLARKIGAFFEAKSCVLAELLPGAPARVATHVWRASDRRPRRHNWSLEDFLETVNLGTSLSSHATVVADVADEPRGRRDKYTALGIRSLLTVPGPGDGGWRFQLSLTGDQPRQWSESEIAVLQEVAERIWTSLKTGRAVESLRSREAAHAFLLKLNDALRPLVDETDIRRTSSSLLREHLRVHRALYAEAGSDPLGYRPTERPLIVPDLGNWLSQDEPLVLPDVRFESNLTTTQRTVLESAGVRAVIGIRLVKGDRVVAHLLVHESAPRSWTSDDVSLVREVAERTWTAIRRARAEADLRSREEQLSQLNNELESRVAARTSQIQHLFVRLIETQENERARFARDVHDQLGQPMTAVRMHLAAVRARAAGDLELDAQVKRAQEVAAELDESIDFLTWQLRPVALDDLGLTAALNNLVTVWSERFGIPATFEASGRIRNGLTPDAEMNLYRVAQEALHNVVKHSGATEVAVRFRNEPVAVVLEVQDNGSGFDPGSREAGDGALGLVSMRERAMLAGGTLRIDSRDGAGTTIGVKIVRDGYPKAPITSRRA
jgi:signal transduction histidine kinase